MTSVTPVPETALMGAGELTADDARHTLRSYGRGALVKQSFVRFRYGDGFSSSRALALQLVLSLIPLFIAVVGLSEGVPGERPGEVLRRTLLGLAPGTSGDLVEQTLERSQRSAGNGGTVALVLGLVTALVALTTAMGQVERGANRIYGIPRDRPSTRKYARAALMALVAGIPLVLGFLVVVAGTAVSGAVEAVYGVDAVVVQIVRWPVGLLVMLGALTVLLRRSPRRHQPGVSWLMTGATVALLLWALFTLLLVLYVRGSSSFGTVYGPLTGIIALLLWANLTSVAIFLGLSFSAQLEAVRAGLPHADPLDGQA